MRRLTTTALLLVSSLLWAWPSDALEPSGLLSEFSLTSWTESDGIPLGSINALAQDADGYLWIGADGGVIRFDGARFVRWPLLSTSDLPQASALALCVSSDGSIWVGFADSAGVRRIRDGRLDEPGTDAGLLRSVTALAEDGAGTVWAISDGALFVFRHGRWSPVPLNGTQAVSSLSLNVGRAGSLFVGTTTGVWQQSEGGAFSKIHDTFSWGVSQASTGAIWFTDERKGFIPPRGANPRTDARAGNGYRLVHDQRGNLWVATIGQGLWRIREDATGNHQIDTVVLASGLLSDSVPALMTDREGNLWIGTTGGLQRLSHRLLTPVSHPGLVISLEATADGLWAGTQEGLNRYPHDARGDSRPIRVSSGRTYSLHRDKSEALWIGTDTGVTRLVNGARSAPVMPSLRRVFSITSDSRGNIWLNDLAQGVFRWHEGSVERVVLPVTGARPLVLYADSHDTLWITFQGGSVGTISADGIARVFGPADGLDPGTHTIIRTIMEDSSQVVWLGGDGGVSRYDGRFTTINRRHGLPSNHVWAIVEDASGSLWLNLDIGVMRISRADLSGLANAETPPRYAMFNASDGLAGAAIRNVRAVKGPNGRLWFIRGGSLTVLSPSEVGLNRDAVANALRIDGVTADDVRLKPDDAQRIGAGARSLQISYTALSLSLASKIRFRYRLQGFDTDWVNAGSRRVAYYTNLPPGAYRFRVEADINDGAAAGKEWNFVIEPYFYQTRMFASMCLGLGLVLVWTTWRFRLALLRREFAAVLAERARLSREMHDTLLQNLVGLALQLNVLSGASAFPKAVSEGLARVRRQLDLHIKDARQSIWDLRSTARSNADIVTAVREFGTRGTSETAMEFTFAVSGDVRRCSPKLEHNLLRIAQEGINNAVRHSGATSLRVTLDYAETELTLRIMDDGCGFEPDTVEEGNRHCGLMGMRERAGDMGGHFHINSAPTRGTEIVANLPIRSVRQLRTA